MALDSRPISAVLQDIVANIQGIIRAEVRLAKTELTDEMGKARSASLLCGIGAVMGILSAMLLLLAIVYALSLVLPIWAAFLVVAAAVGIAAVVTLQRGIGQFKTIHAAPKTAASLKENVQWAKQLTK